MLELNFLTGLAAIVFLMLNIIGYSRVLIVPRTDDRVYHLTRFVVALAIAYVWRGGWWDITPVAVGEIYWSWMVEFTGARKLNSLFHVVAVYAGYHGLHALYFMIPEDQRGPWRWWTAWAYPPISICRGLMVALRFMLGKRNGN